MRILTGTRLRTAHSYGPDNELAVATLPVQPLAPSPVSTTTPSPHPCLRQKESTTPQLERHVGPTRVVPRATTGSWPPPHPSSAADMRRRLLLGTAPQLVTAASEARTFGLLERYGTDLADLTTYFATIGQTNNVPITLLSTDGTSTSCLYTKACRQVRRHRTNLST